MTGDILVSLAVWIFLFILLAFEDEKTLCGLIEHATINSNSFFQHFFATLMSTFGFILTVVIATNYLLFGTWITKGEGLSHKSFRRFRDYYHLPDYVHLLVLENPKLALCSVVLWAVPWNSGLGVEEFVFNKEKIQCPANIVKGLFHGRLISFLNHNVKIGKGRLIWMTDIILCGIKCWLLLDFL